MSRFITPAECIDIALLGNDDYLKRAKGRLLKWSKYVWPDLNLTAVKKVRRELIPINKRTNSIDLPCSILSLSSVNIMDRCGNFIPVYRNQRLHDDIVEVGETKDCGCEFKCGYKLCNTIKGYEAVVSTKEDKNPDGTDVSFTCVDRKGIDGQGFFYEQLQYPKRIYLSGVWTETIIYTEDRKLCKVEVDENGCCCDTNANIDAVCTACGIQNIDSSQCCIGGTAEAPPNDNCDKWIYYCNSKLDWFSIQCGSFPYFANCTNNIYNISELGDRLIFPHNFGWDKVMVRWYDDTSIKDTEIPIIAIDTFIMGLKWWDCRFNDNKQALADKYGNIYSKLKFGLIKELNKYRIAEISMIMNPPAYIPGFTRDRVNWWGMDGFYSNEIYGW